MLPSDTRAQFNVCNRAWIGGGCLQHINNHHFMTYSTVNQTIPPTAAVASAYIRPWEGYWYLDTTNHAIWWDGTSTTGSTFVAWDSSAVIQRARGFGDLGTSYAWGVCGVVNELDTRIDGDCLDGLRTVSTGTLYSTSCALRSSATESITFLHELGHGYGYSHFDDWISAINTSQWDVFSCEVGTASPTTSSMFVTPDPLLTQCHDIAYGINDAVDFSISPVMQAAGCELETSLCTVTPGNTAATPTTISSTATLSSVQVWFTLFNNRDAFTGPLTIGYFLSRDAMLDAGDVRIGQQVLASTTWPQGLVQTRTSNAVVFNPQTAMPGPLGTVFRVLIRVDDNTAITESRETNNVTDTSRFLRRL